MLTVWKAFYIHCIFIKIEHVKLDILLPDHKTNIFLMFLETRFSQICNRKNVTLRKVLGGQSSIDSKTMLKDRFLTLNTFFLYAALLHKNKISKFS